MTHEQVAQQMRRFHTAVHLIWAAGDLPAESMHIRNCMEHLMSWYEFPYIRTRDYFAPTTRVDLYATEWKR